MAKFHYKESPTPKQKKAFSPYLSEDEELILVTGLSKAFIRSKLIIYLLFPGIIFFGFGLGAGWLLGFSKTWATVLALSAMLLSAILRTMHVYHANRYLLTTRRVIIKRGLFSVKLTAALYDKITHLEVVQNVVDRLLLHHGSIIVNTAGLNKGEIVLKFVDYPMEIKNLLERLINKEREQFGARVSSITTVEGEIIS
ncbi:PH domain-containing protein [Candidatus Daviesbacteria bacterium]|nr:PH domain-containing protein [Candidatus Daviesbacteria bacterium]